MAACSGIKVETDFDPNADFAELASFEFHPAPPGAEPDPRLVSTLLDERIRRAVDQSLTRKGFQRAAEGAAPDFWVAYHVGVESKIDVSTLHHSYPYTTGRYDPWGGYSETVVREYEQGTLLLDVIDPGSNALMWRGSGKVLVKDHKTPEKREKRVQEVVERVFRDFPPGR